MRKSSSLFYYAVVAALAGFLFGFDTVVISGAEQRIQELWNLTTGMHGLAISMALWGTLLGALLGHRPSDRWGRKNTLSMVGSLYLISALGSAFAPEVYSFMAFRFIGGLGIGISTIAAPLYIAEIAPASHRGRLTGMFQFNIVFGILVAYLSNALISNLGDNAWRWMLGIEAAPAAVYFLLSFYLPKSPRWLIVYAKDVVGARHVLQKIHDYTSEEINQWIERIQFAQSDPSGNQRFFTRKLLRPIALAIFIAIFNQLSGINAILYFAPRIFEMTGLGSHTALIQSVGIGAVNLVFTLIGLRLIDTYGRRQLLLIGSLGYILSLGLCSYAFAQEVYAIVPYCIFAFIAAHAIGQGAVIWVFIGEIFPNRHRASGQALGSFTHWLFAAILTLAFPHLVVLWDAWVLFGFFCSAMVLQLIWVWRVVPETKGLNLEDISEKL